MFLSLASPPVTLIMSPLLSSTMFLCLAAPPLTPDHEPTPEPEIVLQPAASPAVIPQVLLFCLVLQLSWHQPAVSSRYACQLLDLMDHLHLYLCQLLTQA